MLTSATVKVIHTGWMGWEFANEKLETGSWISVDVQP
jgi:hypothetical protein